MSGKAASSGEEQTPVITRGHNRASVLKEANDIIDGYEEKIADLRTAIKETKEKLIKGQLGMSMGSFRQIRELRKMNADTRAVFFEEVNEGTRILGLGPLFEGVGEKEETDVISAASKLKAAK